MVEKIFDDAYKSIIEKGRKDKTVMEICYAEYLGDYGKHPPEDWHPTDEEVFRVIERIGYN